MLKMLKESIQKYLIGLSEINKIIIDFYSSALKMHSDRYILIEKPLGVEQVLYDYTKVVD
jgi:hypothetical protein